MRTLKQFIKESRRQKQKPDIKTVYHGTPNAWHSGEQVSTDKGEFHMTPHADVAAGYAFDNYPVAPGRGEGLHADEPEIHKYEIDASKYFKRAHGNRPAKSQSTIKRSIEDKLTQDRQNKGYETTSRGVARQVGRVMASGKATRGGWKYEGEMGARPKGDGPHDVEYIIPKFGKANITKTGYSQLTPENNPESSPSTYKEPEYKAEKTPQTKIAEPTKRPFLGFSAFKGLQMTGRSVKKDPRFVNIIDRGNYFQSK